MRGRIPGVMVVITGLAGVVLAGCATPPDGIDGDLAAGWRSMPEPASWVPAAGTCHTAYRPASPLPSYLPVGCRYQHNTETAHVGEFTGAAAERVTPPPEGSPEWRQAYAECDEAAAGYLGADFRSGHLWLGVAVPSVAAWEGGSRWFRCDLQEFNVYLDLVVSRAESLAGALAAESDLVLRCGESTDSTDTEFIDRMEPVDCGEPHDTEFVGTWWAPDIPYPAGDDEDSQDRVHDGCREQVAAYVDVPVDGNLVFRTGTIADWMSEADWDNGDRGFRCYLYLADEGFTESLAGAGTAGLPIR